MLLFFFHLVIRRRSKLVRHMYMSVCVFACVSESVFVHVPLLSHLLTDMTRCCWAFGMCVMIICLIVCRCNLIICHHTHTQKYNGRCGVGLRFKNWVHVLVCNFILLSSINYYNNNKKYTHLNKWRNITKTSFLMF